MKVSVLITTYNHERFLAQAIDSALMQQVDFPFEIIIGEDCSTDGTRSIVCNYATRYPDQVTALLHPRNMGASSNFGCCLARARGTYIAVLEGDDFWTSPHKLRDQVEFLDCNPEFALCFTDSAVVDENGGTISVKRLAPELRKDLTQLEILNGSVPPTNTTVFRNLLPKLPDSFYGVVNGDVFLFSLLTEFGNAAYLDCTTACYRVHDGGIWSCRSREYMLQSHLATKLALLSVFSRRYDHRLLSSIDGIFFDLMAHWKKNRQFLKCFRVFLHCAWVNTKYLRHFLVRFCKMIKGKSSFFLAATAKE